MDNRIMASALLIVAGSLGLYFCRKFLIDPDFARRHVENSPKAWFWKNLWGVKKTLKITKNIFIPIGFISSFGLFALGVALLYLHFFN